MKKIRIRCRTIDATNTSAAQWCVWRISSPASTDSERSTTERYASLIFTPRSGAYGPV